MKTVKSLLNCLVICLGASAASQSSSLAEPCGLNFSPNPSPASVTIEAYWQINDSYTSPDNLALFRDTVTTGNSTVPAGTYLGWCIDLSNSIANGPDAYSVLMYSSCDPNLDAELMNLKSITSSTTNLVERPIGIFKPPFLILLADRFHRIPIFIPSAIRL
jgi:hypothetical protein